MILAQFGTGKIHSLLGTDTVAIGPFAVEGQTLGVVDHESATTGKSNIFDHIDFQGIVGFGFPSLATAGGSGVVEYLNAGCRECCMGSKVFF